MALVPVYQRRLLLNPNQWWKSAEDLLKELNAYAKLVSVGSYCIVYDTIIDELPKDMFPDRPWEPGNSPLSAVREFLNSDDSFIIEERIHQKLLLSVAKEGYLKRIK